jgi:hypothetical protein
MLLLTSINDKLQITTSGSVATDVHASWVDNASGTITPGRTNTPFASASTFDVVAAPASNVQRNVKTLNIRNKDAALTQTVTVQHTDGSTVATLFKCDLAAGEELEYTDSLGWVAYDATGRVKKNDGAFQNVTRLDGTTAQRAETVIADPSNPARDAFAVVHNGALAVAPSLGRQGFLALIGKTRGIEKLISSRRF